MQEQIGKAGCEMARDVFFREDIQNVLKSVSLAGNLDFGELELGQWSNDPVQVQKLVDVYRAGFDRAIDATGLAFGLEPIDKPG